MKTKQRFFSLFLVLSSFIGTHLGEAGHIGFTAATIEADTTTLGVINEISPGNFSLVLNSAPSGESAYCTSSPCYQVLSSGSSQYVAVENGGYYVMPYNVCIGVNYDEHGTAYCASYEGSFNVQFEGNAPYITGTQIGGKAYVGGATAEYNYASPITFIPTAPYILGVKNNTSNYFSWTATTADALSSCCSGDTTSCTNGSCSPILAPGATQYVNLSNVGYITLNYTVCTDNISSCPTCSNLGSFGAEFTTTINSNGSTTSSFTAESFYGGTTTTGSIASGVYPVSFNSTITPCPIGSTFPTPQTYSSGFPYRGVNMAGCDFADFYPPCACGAIYFINQGATTIRLPVLWEYLQPDVSSDPSVITNIDFTQGDALVYADLVTTLTDAGLYVIIDMHNYMRYDAAAPGVDYTGPNYIIGYTGTDAIPGPSAAQYANAWRCIALQFKNNPLVLFDLMNEPNHMQTQLILDNYNAAIDAIRSVENTSPTVAYHTILLEGNGFSCLGAWVIPNSDYGTCTGCEASNASVFIPSAIVDPGSNYVINVHEYFNGGTTLLNGEPSDCCGSGLTACIPSTTVLTAENFSGFTNYLQTNNLKAFLSELGGIGNQNGNSQSDAENCAACIDTMLTAIENVTYTVGTGYGFIGWTGWSGGSFQQTYNLDLNPINYTGTTPNQVIQMTDAFNRHMTPLP